MTRHFAGKTISLFAALCLLAGTAVLPILSSVADAQAPADHAHQLGLKVKCMCGGCNDSAGGCYHVGGAFSGPCDTAKSALRTIEQRIAKGDSDDLILQSFVQEFGPAVYVEPPRQGFGLVAWWIPVVALVCGLGLVVAVISRWRARPVLATPAGQTTAISAEELARARDRVARETED